MALSDLMQSQLWSAISAGHICEFQSMNFQPVGGMGMIGRTFGRELGELFRCNANVTEIRLDSSGVTVTYQDTSNGGPIHTAKAQWCLCTIPASILGQIPMNLAAPMKNAIASDRRDLSDYGRGKWPAHHAAVRRIAQR
jgi:monoamine oxidase